MNSQTIRLGTRRSQLALWQANYVRSGLQSAHPGLSVEIVEIVTEGDRRTDAPLAAFGGKGLFLKEIESSLAQGDIDIAVHSMKDVTAQIPPGLILDTICERASPHDALISRHGPSLQALPQGAVVGSCSLRRRCLLKAQRPDLVMQDLRGNVPTRLQRLHDGDFDAIVLAEAGLKRLDLAHHISLVLPVDVCLPAVGQGAVGIECREDDEAITTLLQALNHTDTHRCVSAERAVNRALGGDCHAPIAAYARFTDTNEELRLEAAVGLEDGSRIVRAQDVGPAHAAVALGERVGQALLSQGAAEILQVSSAS